MTRFAPLAYVWSTLTVWHLVVLAVILCLPFASPSTWQGDGAALLKHAIMTGPAIGLLYIMGAIILGQAFGDKYPFAQVWPTSALVGVLVSFTFVGWVIMSDSGKVSMGEAAFVFSFFSFFLGLAFNLFFYVMPRMANWFGLVDYPMFSWAVRL